MQSRGRELGEKLRKSMVASAGGRENGRSAVRRDKKEEGILNGKIIRASVRMEEGEGEREEKVSEGEEEGGGGGGGGERESSKKLSKEATSIR